MKISDFQAYLEEIKQKHGDLPVLEDVQKMDGVVFRFPETGANIWTLPMAEGYYIGEDIDLKIGDKFLWL